jgi:hypothetical protein
VFGPYRVEPNTGKEEHNQDKVQCDAHTI